MLKKTKTVALIFYIIGILYLLYTLFTCYTTFVYVQSVMGSDYYATIRFSDIVSVFVGQIGPFLFYTCGFFGIGYLIQLVAAHTEALEGVAQTAAANSSTPSYAPQTTTASAPDYVAADADSVASQNATADAETGESTTPAYDDETIVEGPEGVTVDISEPEADVVDNLEEKIAEAIDNAETTSEYNELENYQEEQKEEA